MTVNLWWFAYPALGAFVGFFAGLLGVGGGSIIVPILTSLFIAQDFPREQIVHLALGTSMATIILTSFSSLSAHHRHGAVKWSIVRHITPGILVGTFMSTFIASHINSTKLAIFFTCFTVYVAIQMLLNIKPKPNRQLPGFFGMSLAGAGIGAISALVAIGGGSLSVPFMIWCNVKTHNAIGTSAAIGLPIALAGAAGYLINGWNMTSQIPYTLGFIYLPALILTALCSILTAPAGARLAHHLPVPILKKIFAAMMVILCIKMLYSLFGS